MLCNAFLSCIGLICVANSGFIHSQFPDLQTVVLARDLTALYGNFPQTTFDPTASAVQKEELFFPKESRWQVDAGQGSQVEK